LHPYDQFSPWVKLPLERLDKQGYRWYNYRMIDTQTTKIGKETLKQLRMLHALTGERMLVIMARLVEAELARVQKEVETVTTTR